MNKNHALCVGNNYPDTSAELAGCVPDALDWAELLGREGYTVEVRLEATRDETLAVLREMVARAGFGDRIVFTYSGHGSWVTDQDGDEADRRDEVLVMADYMNGGLISDDDIAEVTSHLGFGAGFLMLSDSCHSGTMTRFAPNHGAGRPRFLSPAAFTEISPNRAVELERLPPAPKRAAASLISGCADHEYSYDARFPAGPNGAFTRAAIDTYRPGVDLATWHRDIRGVLPSSMFPQTPQLTTATPYRRRARAL